MKRQLSVAIFLLGAAGFAHAQAAMQDASAADRNVAAPFTASLSEKFTLLEPPAAVLTMPPGTTLVAAPSLPAESADPAPAPAPPPDPKFLYGGRDDFRWQLAIGADWIRFRSNIFNASAVGFKTSVTYFTNEWFGVEGDITADFAPTIFDREHVKLLVYGAGPKIAWRERRWEPWAHAILGGMHEQPQTADFGRNAFAVELGGGADYRINPRFSGRLEGDWLHSSFFSHGQNNFELMGGVVFHF